MNTVLGPLVAEEEEMLGDATAAPVQGAPAIVKGGARGSSSLMTTVGLVEGEILTYLEEHGGTTLRDLVRKLGRSASMVTMGVGALIRERLAQGRQQDTNIFVDPT